MESSKIQFVKSMTDETNDDIVQMFLNIAKEKILNRAYPFGTGDEPLPAKYQSLQLEIAIYLLNKRGAEGEVTHNENGVNRSYESASVPESMLSQVLPYAVTLGG